MDNEGVDMETHQWKYTFVLKNMCKSNQYQRPPKYELFVKSWHRLSNMVPLIDSEAH